MTVAFGDGALLRIPSPYILGPTTACARPTAASCFGHAVGRAAHARRAAVQDVGVNLRGGHVPVPEQLLDSPDVVVLLQKMCRERVAQRVGCAALGDAGLADRRLHHSLQHGLVQVVPPALKRLPMEVDARSGKTHCHAHSRPAFGYFRMSAVGSSTQPAPCFRSS